MKSKLALLVIVALALALGSWPLLAGGVGKDLINNVAIDQVLDPNTYTGNATDHTCDSLDMKGYGAVTFIANLGGSADSLTSALYLEGEVEIGTGNGSWSDAADSYLSDYVAGTNDGCFFLANSSATGANEDSTVYYTTLYPPSTYRYARVVINKTGNHSTGIPLSVTAIRHAKFGQ